MLNSRLGLFSAAPTGSGRKYPHPQRHPFSRSYGVILPSSLTRVCPRALGSSPRLPVSVYGTGTRRLARGFSRQRGFGQFATFNFAPHRLSGSCRAGFAWHGSLPAWTGTTNGPLRLPSCVTPSLVTAARWYRNINRFSIAYAFRPRLRPRLTLSGRAFLRKPRACGGRDSHPPFRYSCRHSRFCALHRSFRSGFRGRRTLPYHGRVSPPIRSFGGGLEPRYIFGAEPLDQ